MKGPGKDASGKSADGPRAPTAVGLPSAGARILQSSDTTYTYTSTGAAQVCTTETNCLYTANIASNGLGSVASSGSSVSSTTPVSSGQILKQVLLAFCVLAAIIL